MKYKLTIIRYDDNKNYESEMAKFKEDTRYEKFNKPWDNRDEGPSREVAERSLEVFLTEEEYKKVKAEVIKIFE